MVREQEQQSSGVAMIRIDGSEVRRLRESRDLTQLYLATAVGVTTDTISRWENGRYPSIKRENGLKLAAVLEVPLENILERESVLGGELPLEKVPDSPESVPPAWKSLLYRSRLAAILLFLGGAGFLGWLFFPVPASVTLHSTRHLPAHSPPGRPFPVIVEILTSGDLPVPLLVTEHLPVGMSLLTTVPTAASIGADTVKWLQKQAGVRQRFGYLVEYSGEASAVLEFSGNAALRKGKKLRVVTNGNRKFIPEPYHYADTNRDYRIDDDEILVVYDEYAGLPGFDIGIAEVEAIWMSSGYRWNVELDQFEILPQESE